MSRPSASVEHDLQYRQIFEATTDGLVVNDPETGVVVEVNPAFCRMHGYDYDELIGIHPTAFIHPDDHGLFGSFLDAFHNGATFHAHARDVRKDGSVFEVEVRAEAFMFRGKQHLLGVVRDISETADANRLLEQRVAERTHELAALVEVARQVTATRERSEFMRATIAQFRSIVACDGVYVYLRHGGTYALEHGDGPPSAASFPVDAFDLVASDLDAGRGATITNTESDARAAQASAVGLKPPDASVIIVPLLSSGDAIGFLAVHRVCDDHDHAPRVMELAQAIASQVAIAVTNQRLADAARAAAALDERHRIARDLHDAVSQTLFSTTMHARAAEMAVDKLELPADHAVRQHVADVASLTLGALAEMRSLIFELRPGALTEAGLTLAVRKHAAALTARHQLEIEVRAPDDRLPLGPSAEEELYRIVQEALANIVKHASAGRAVVELWRTEAAIMLRVSDDGVGFDTALDRPGHLGLHTMRERAVRAGGRLELSSRPGQGTSVVVRVPVEGRA